MYVAVKGGQKAIEAAHKLLDIKRRGPREIEEITVEQITHQLSLAVERVLAEGSLYDPPMAALAVKQACGDLVEAIFLLRAARATLKRFGYSQPIDSSKMRLNRRISGTFKDVPGGQILGATFDYTHRLINEELGRNCDARQDCGSRQNGDSPQNCGSRQNFGPPHASGEQDSPVGGDKLAGYALANEDLAGDELNSEDLANDALNT
ncbi:MAG: carbon-phosphorus lyase complex subunit PhnI, partial [Deltaproteobacteria bacterium]|nr:carbon-phosphorus lyase complex subunit PhnI [Deltaproteobacteria bacterium]